MQQAYGLIEVDECEPLSVVRIEQLQKRLFFNAAPAYSKWSLRAIVPTSAILSQSALQLSD